MPFDPSKPYNSLPDLPPRVEIETREVLRKVISARSALAELKGYCETIPNSDILLNSILLQEAKASSEIENIVTTHDSLYKAAILNDKDPANKEVIRYRQAVYAGTDMLSERGVINTNTAIRIYQILKETTASVRKIPGTAIKNISTDQLYYTPPVGETLIRDKLDNLWWYVNSPENETVDPLIRMAIMHYQFEAIHPFTDGNGRIGRILNVLFLVQQSLLRFPILYLSTSILEKKSQYYELLRGVTSRDEWIQWILFMLDCVHETSLQTINTIRAIHIQMQTTLDKVRAELPRLRYSKEIVEILFMFPYCRIDHLVERGLAVRQSASMSLRKLENIGILQSEKHGKHTIYRNVCLWELLSNE